MSDPSHPSEADPGDDLGELHEDPAEASGPARLNALERELTGDLPCVVCKYNLKGISIRDACPECGTAVRATILAHVDPYAKELRPIEHPRIIAVGLVAWAFGAFLAAILSWWPYTGVSVSGAWRLSVCVLAVLSGLGSMILVRPHRGVPKSQLMLATLGVCMYLPIVWSIWKLADPAWGFQAWTYPPGIDPRESAQRLGVRLVFDAALLVLLLLLRPAARLLVARSLVLRSGRVDRQTMLAMAAAAAIALIGDAMMRFALTARTRPHESVLLIGEIVVILGSALVTLGLAGTVIDALRIARSIIIPTRTLSDISAPRSKAPAAHSRTEHDAPT